MENELLHFVLKNYKKEEFPCLYNQFSNWQKTKPLANIKIFDGSPVFQNTCAKYAALLAGGAELTVGISDNFIYDSEIYSWLPDFGIRAVRNEFEHGEYDVVLDCAGIHHKKKPARGFVELTRSGVPFYDDSPLPCISVDDSRTKLLEDFLGTGDGFVRGLQASGVSDIENKSFLVFGFGKVGKGICMRLQQAGAKVSVVDNISKVKPFADIPMIDIEDVQGVLRCVEKANCIVTATGVAGALHDRYPVTPFLRENLLLANMGVEDEFGPDIDDNCILADNKPLNFILDEPTRMSFIDGIMALHNEVALYLLNNNCVSGVSETPIDLDEKFLKITSEFGGIDEDLKLLDILRQGVKHVVTVNKKCKTG